MTREDYPNFVLLMNKIYKLCQHKGVEPDEEVIDFHFNSLIDLDFGAIAENIFIRLQRDNKFFPEISEFRGVDEQTVIAQANEDFDFIKGILLWPYHPELGPIIKNRNEYLRNRFNVEGRPELYQIAIQWEDEIKNNENVGIVRAQFLKAYKSKVFVTMKCQIKGDHLKQLMSEIKKIGDSKL